MKTNKHLIKFEIEFDYFDYLLTVVRKPHNIGVLKNIRKQIKALKAFIKSESKNSFDTKVIEQAQTILEKFQELERRYYLIYPKK
jgi:hypothetical protein